MVNCIYIMGKSSTGKDTIFNKIRQKINTNTYILYTTRPKRDGEKQGVEYNFITKDYFEYLKKQDKVIEARHYNVINEQGQKDVWTYATINDNQWMRPGDFLTIGTLESYNSILEYSAKHKERKLNLIPIYIEISEEERRKRAEKREKTKKIPNYEEMERRLKADNFDFTEEKLRNAGITENERFQNDNLEECIYKILKYIEQKRVDIKEKTSKSNKEIEGK